MKHRNKRHRQKSHRPKQIPNTPKMGNCYFCLEDKPCTAAQIPPSTIKWMREKFAGDPFLLELVDEFETTYLACCADCFRAPPKEQVIIIVEHLEVEAELARRAASN